LGRNRDSRRYHLSDEADKMTQYDWWLLSNQIRLGEHVALMIGGVILEWNYS